MTTAGFGLFDTAVGTCAIAWNGDATRVTGVQLPGPTAADTRRRMQAGFPDVAELPPPAPVEAVIARITAMLDGAPDDLADVPLDLSAVPPFHRRVYDLARTIAPGRTLTYGDVARRLGEPGAARAVGQALGANPFAPVVPCHRVLAAGNASGGFSAPGGVAVKLQMLEREGARFGPQPGLFDA